MVRRKSYVAERDPEREGALCSVCPLKGKSEPVFGEGPMGTRIAVVGEGPGINETRLGRPFVGASGELLEFLLTDAGSARSSVYLDNSTLCFPPGGNLEDFLTIHKRQLRQMGLSDTFRHPVDCCRPRLFRALGVETCKDCGKYRFGPAAERCSCKAPIWVAPSNPRRKIDVVIPLGNGALRSLTGLEGISAWRGSALNLGEKIEYAKKSEDRRKARPDAEDEEGSGEALRETDDEPVASGSPGEAEGKAPRQGKKERSDPTPKRSKGTQKGRSETGRASEAQRGNRRAGREVRQPAIKPSAARRGRARP